MNTIAKRIEFKGEYHPIIIPKRKQRKWKTFSMFAQINGQAYK